ncbi:hypothetical protein NM688_g6182 [Phlebia brevispora]|uniref:Uncharacterized protein n=1 Tax=Phlebia brevispora TaxID=194682 RepID=A0ACC1SJA2_9APHY|nr:hypothetical protein NM688_g6182 [Phlebia brevispora]
MVDWESPSVIEACATAFDKIALFTFGVFWFSTSEGDILVLVCEILNQIPMTRATFEVIALMGSTAVICASGNLLLRTMTIWRDQRLVVIFLGLAGFGQFVFMLAVTAIPIATEGNGFDFGNDGPSRVHAGSSLPFYLYTFIFDLTILIFTIIGLYRQQPAQSSPLWKTLYRRGILYFIVTLLVNVPLLVLGWLNLNVYMSGMFAAPNLVVSVIASSGAVTSLLSLKEIPHAELVGTTMQTAALTNMPTQRLSTHISLAGLTWNSLDAARTQSVTFKALHTENERDVEALHE